MNKEEILSMSRKENKNLDIAELDVIRQANNVAIKVGLLLCCVINIVHIILYGDMNYGCWIIFFGMTASTFLIKFIKLRKKHELFLTIFYFAIAILFAVTYLLRWAGVM